MFMQEQGPPNMYNLLHRKECTKVTYKKRIWQHWSGLNGALSVQINQMDPGTFGSICTLSELN